MPTAIMPPKFEDTVEYLLDLLINPRPQGCGTSGYDLYIENAINLYLKEEVQQPSSNADNERISPVFMDAAWHLSKLGFLRLGSQRCTYRAPQNNNGSYFSLTVSGQEWLKKSTPHDILPVSPSRFGEFLAQFRTLFGDGFYQRSQEAIACHQSGHHLACCALSGAASESILLKIASEKMGEREALKAYRGRSGRQEIEKKISHALPTRTAETLKELTYLIKYWRDEAAHGEITELSEFEAYEALAKLLRLALFAKQHWNTLTAV